MRIELFHPMIVGFPISFLIIGTFLRISCIFYPQILSFSRLLIGLGILFGICAVFTGELAREVVQQDLCDQKVLGTHETLAYVMLVTYSIAYLLDRFGKWNKVFENIALFIFILAPILLVFTGFYGGRLVFQQGAAVQNICKEPLKTLAK